MVLAPEFKADCHEAVSSVPDVTVHVSRSITASHLAPNDSTETAPRGAGTQFEVVEQKMKEPVFADGFDKRLDTAAGDVVAPVPPWAIGQGEEPHPPLTVAPTCTLPLLPTVNCA